MGIDAFTGRAQAYVKARPGYPDAVMDYILALAPDGAVFADIGAGTGKFTQLLARYGCRIYAVEPNADMREQLALADFPNAVITDGTAEATKIPAGSVDAIVCAQSLNKFDLDAFRTECERIGRGNPVVIALHNFAYSNAQTLANYKKSTGAFYREPLVKEFPNPIHFTREGWLLYHASMSGNPQAGDEGYESHIAEKNAIFDRDSVDGLLRLELMTRVYSEKLMTE